MGSKRVEAVKLIKEAPSKKVDAVFTGLTYVLATLLLVFAIFPTVSTMATINKEMKEKKRVSTALDDKITALSMLDDEYKENEASIKDLTLLFPSSGNFSLFLSNIDAVVTRNNFILESISFLEHNSDRYQITTKSLDPWSVRMSVKGKKVYLMTLLKDLEAMPMFPVVETLTFSSETDENGNTGYSLLLRIYHIDSTNFYD